MRKNIYIIVLLIALSVLFLGGCGSNVVATVNGEKITAQELDEQVGAVMESFEQQGMSFDADKGKEIEQMMRKDILSQMIDQKLILAEAKRLNLMPTDKEVQEQIDNLKKQLGTEGEFKKFLAANGVNEPKLGDFMKQQLAMDKIQQKLASEVSEPTQEEIKSYYEQNKAQFTEQEQRQVRHILIGTGDYSNGKNRTDMDAKVLALQVVDKLKAGGGFASLAKQYSDDPGSKENGGQYPPFSKGSGFVAEFEDAAFSLKQGEFTSEPVKTSFGYHIILLEKVVPAKVHSFDEVKEQIINSIKSQALNDKTQAFLQELRDKAKIDNSLAEKPAPKSDSEKATNN